MLNQQMANSSIRQLNPYVNLSTPTADGRRLYDYTQFEGGHDYAFEQIEGGDQAYMTSQGKGLRKGDYLLLKDREAQPIRYRIEEIDYYADPSDMWMASLRRVVS